MPLNVAVRRIAVSKYALPIAVLLAACILVLADCTPQAKVTTSQAQIPAVAPGTARVWFFRGWDSPSGQGFVYGAAPTIYANGTPVGVTVAQSSGVASLDDAALRAVEQWRFVPATRGGTAVPAVAEVPVRFRLTN